MKITDIENYLQFPNFVIKGNKMMLEKAEKELLRLGIFCHPWNKQRKKLPEHNFIRVWNTKGAGDRPYMYWTNSVSSDLPVINLTETKLEKVKHYFMDKWFALGAASILSIYITLMAMFLAYILGLPEAQCRWWGGVLFGLSYFYSYQYFRSKRK